MTLLLDTSAFIWWLTDDDRLGPRARAAVADSSRRVHVSAVSAWEIAIKRSLGKLTFDGDVAALVESQDFDELPIRFAHGLEVESLPHHHRDPFDRMLIAQSRYEGMVVLTGDRIFTRYDVQLIPAGA